MSILRFGAASAAVLCLASSVHAATPASGTITDSVKVLDYTGATLLPSTSATANNKCANDATSDVYTLTVTLTGTTSRSLKIDATPPATADIVMSIFAGTTSVKDSDAGSVGGVESVTIPAVNNATTVYKIAVCLFGGAAPNYTGKVTLVENAPPPPPPPPLAGAPRLVTLVSPPDLGNSAGEPSIGYDLKNKRAMYISYLQTLRVTPAEYSSTKDAAGAALPKSCPALWEDVSAANTSIQTLDPILFTNQSLGEAGANRTFVSQLTGANSAFAYSDDAVATWTTGQLGPADGGVDHQTVGAGPYPATSATFPLVPPGNPGYAVYYCSQSVADAFCARSDTGGLTFNEGTPFGKATPLGCGAGDIGGLHGHLRVAPDGAIAIPFKSCGGQQGIILSTDAGTTYTSKKVPNTTSASTDPQLAWSKPDAQGKTHGYFCMTDGNGHPKATVTTDHGDTWAPTFDLGAQVGTGIKHSVFAQAIAGDADRAACAFIGTETEGNPDATDFPGIWYGFVSYTFDGGATWTTINVTPNDPVQGKGGICTAGTTCGSNRNLLDFNEITLDERGRVWFGYADGCTSATCVGGGGAVNDFGAKGTIARQIGGKSLYKAFDSTISTVPQEPCLAGARSNTRATLSWVTPDDGGKTITGYKVFRSTAVAGPYTQIGTVGVKNAYDDNTADASVAKYFYRVNATYSDGSSTPADGLNSNLLDLALVQGTSACAIPGLGILTDTPGTGGTAPGGAAGPGMDLQSLSIAQPYAGAGTPKLVFTIKTDAGQAAQPTNAAWYVSFKRPDGQYRGVRMDFASGAAAFSYYTPSTSQGGGTDGRFVASSAPADPASSYDAAGGVITIIVKLSDLGVNPGDLLGGFNAGMTLTTQAAPGIPGATATVDEMPNGLGYTGSFKVLDAIACAPNTPPVAALDADPITGLAPLDVTLTGSATDADAIDTIKTFSLDFGDSSAPVAQATGNFGVHTYATPGNYAARMFAVDSRDVRSSNTPEKVIVVYGFPVADAGDDFTANDDTTPQLSGSRSQNSNGGALTYAWTQTSGSPAVTLANADTATPSFVAPHVCADTALGFKLKVGNIAGFNEDSVTVTVHHDFAAPAAAAGADFTVARGTPGALDGRGSSVDGCRTATFLWEQIAGPTVALSGASSATPSFTAPNVSQDTLLVFRLTVTDSAGQSSSDLVTATVDSSAPLIIGNSQVGALPLATLAWLGLLAALRRRR